MDWLRENWFWVAIIVFFFWMHRGHGGHGGGCGGGHGGHGGGSGHGGHGGGGGHAGGHSPGVSQASETEGPETGK